MKYFLHDLTVNKPPHWPSNPMIFTSQDDLLRFWHKHIRDFKLLNITGNDVMTCHVPVYIGQSIKTDESVFVTETKTYLRPYLVLDEDQRHINIRNWPDPKPAPVIHRSYYFRYKTHHRRGHGASMYRKTLQANQEKFCELDTGEIIAIPPVRRKIILTSGDNWDKVERTWCGIERTKCWKDQRHGKKQFDRKGRKSTDTIRYTRKPGHITKEDPSMDEFQRSLDLSIQFHTNAFNITVSEPESGETAQFQFPFSPDDHQEFDSAIGREIYSWISLWLDEYDNTQNGDE